MARLLSTAALAFCSQTASAFYLPGVAPHEYKDGDPIDLKVNKLSSTKTSLPYEYYHLPFCKPENVETYAENLGEILRGDRIESSKYELAMKHDEYCKLLCMPKYTQEEIRDFSEKVLEEYRINMIVDNLPAATKFLDINQNTVYSLGFPLGFVGSTEEESTKPGQPYLNNHLRYKVLYHTEAAYQNLGSRIVGFEVEAFSVEHKPDGKQKNPDGTQKLKTCAQEGTSEIGDFLMLKPKSKPPQQVYWTYDVLFEFSDVKWASRWDTYLNSADDDQIHWFSIINSLLIVLFLTGMVAMIMARTLNQDVSRYNSSDEADETGWKLVHGDVFRSPKNPNLLSVLVGSGVQLISMLFITLCFAVLGFLSPANRGGLMTAMLLLFVFMGIFAGYTSARLYKSFMYQGRFSRDTQGVQIRLAGKKNTLMTAFLFPGVVFFVFFILNFFVWGKGSSGAVPFGTLFALLFLWFGISVPLCFVGSLFGFRKKNIEFPVNTNLIPRIIQDQPWYMRGVFSIMIGGILPFGAVFIELFFILSSVWLNQFYYVFGFLALVFVILVITCSEISIVLVYFQLCGEDYHWWWRSFLASGSSGVYLFVYGIFYYSTKLDIMGFTSGLMYFGYMLLVSYAFAVGTGTIGFGASFFFVRKIYASIKVD
jgi:transmembrane 9 superfamily protein 2/4